MRLDAARCEARGAARPAGASRLRRGARARRARGGARRGCRRSRRRSARRSRRRGRAGPRRTAARRRGSRGSVTSDEAEQPGAGAQPADAARARAGARRPSAPPSSAAGACLVLLALAIVSPSPIRSSARCFSVMKRLRRCWSAREMSSMCTPFSSRLLAHDLAGQRRRAARRARARARRAPACRAAARPGRGRARPVLETLRLVVLSGGRRGRGPVGAGRQREHGDDRGLDGLHADGLAALDRCRRPPWRRAAAPAGRATTRRGR